MTEVAEGRDYAENVAQLIGEAVEELQDGNRNEALEKLEDGAREAQQLDGGSRRLALETLDGTAIAMGLGDPQFRQRFAGDADE